MIRRFEFVAGTSAKFWEIAAAGKKVWVRYGRLGSGGRSQSWSFPNAQAATKHVEKLIAEKTAKSYVETAIA
jgi:predicted DNA-binding WGR domain protein